MKRLTPSLPYLFFAFALVIPAAAAPPIAARPQAALLPAMPRLSALPGLPPAAAAPREGQGETEREFYQLLRDFESADEAYRRAAPGSQARREADQQRRELYDRGIGILTREGALLDSSAASLENFALEMDIVYAPSEAYAFSLWEQLRGYATLYAWRAFTTATRRELAHETATRNRPASTGRSLKALTWRGHLEAATGFERRYSETLHRRERAGSHPPSHWQLDAYAAVMESAYQAATSLLELDLASGRLSWSEMEELAYGFEQDWTHAEAGSAREEFFSTAGIAAFDAAFSEFERKLVIGGLGEPELLAALQGAHLRRHLRRSTYGTPVGSAYDVRIGERIQRYRASGR